LFVSLIMLMVMTLIGVTGMQNSSMEEKMVANVRDIDLSFQAAEAALREAETSLQVAVLKEFDGSNPGLYQPATRDNQPLWEVDTTWNAGGALDYTGSLAYLSAQPQYIIEELPPVPDPDGSVAADEPLPETQVYRVTARGRCRRPRSIGSLHGEWVALPRPSLYCRRHSNADPKNLTQARIVSR
jgi:type IV pilus assembly protein PilX